MNISITFVRVLVDTLSNQGLDTDQFLHSLVFDKTRLNEANGLVSVAEFDRMLARAIQQTGEPALGLYMGNTIGLEAFNLFGFLCMSAGNLRTAIQAYIQYHRILNDYETPELIEDGEVATFIFHYNHTNEEGNRARAEFALAALIRFARVFVGHDKQPFCATFSYAAPPYESDYKTVFPFPVKFSCPQTSFQFPSHWLASAQSFSNEEVLKTLKSEADKVLRQLGVELTRAESVYQTIVDNFNGCKPDLEAVAQQMNMSGRSLRRHLYGEGATFSDVIQLAMGDIAKEKLQVADSIQEVAYAMGFSEPSSFSRAFLRWTQLTPQQYKSCPF